MEKNILPKNNKRNCIVFFGNPDPKEFSKLSGNKNKKKEKMLKVIHNLYYQMIQ